MRTGMMVISVYVMWSRTDESEGLTNEDEALMMIKESLERNM